MNQEIIGFEFWIYDLWSFNNIFVLINNSPPLKLPSLVICTFEFESVHWPLCIYFEKWTNCQVLIFASPSKSHDCILGALQPACTYSCLQFPAVILTTIYDAFARYRCLFSVSSKKHPVAKGLLNDHVFTLESYVHLASTTKKS